MAWIELHQTLARHPKLIRFAAGLKISRPQALGHLSMLWLWALDYAPSGDLTPFGSEEIASASEWSKQTDTFLSALKASGFVDQDGQIHDWMDYAGRLVEQRVENKNRQKRFRDKTRMPIYRRDGGKCRYCGRPLSIDEFMVDHVLPLARGGDNSPENLVTACNSCNVKKGDRTPEEVGIPLLRNALRDATPDPLRTGATKPNHTKHNHTNQQKEVFDTARKFYEGTKNGLEAEWKNFTKKFSAEVESILPLLLPAIESERGHKAALTAAGQFTPAWKNFQTWINNRCWEQELGKTGPTGRASPQPSGLQPDFVGVG